MHLSTIYLSDFSLLGDYRDYPWCLCFWLIFSMFSCSVSYFCHFYSIHLISFLCVLNKIYDIRLLLIQHPMHLTPKSLITHHPHVGIQTPPGVSRTVYITGVLSQCSSSVLHDAVGLWEFIHEMEPTEPGWRALWGHRWTAAGSVGWEYTSTLEPNEAWAKCTSVTEGYENKTTSKRINKKRHKQTDIHCTGVKRDYLEQ